MNSEINNIYNICKHIADDKLIDSYLKQYNIEKTVIYK